METGQAVKTYFLHPGALFARKEQHLVTTVLGSCVSVCLWDPVLMIGGINHYMLALWNGEGLPSPKYGNIAMAKLIENMLTLGSRKENLKAKVFGGGQVLQNASSLLNISDRNIALAEDVLRGEKIPIVSSDVGGNLGRKVIFDTASGKVLVKKIQKNLMGQSGEKAS